MAVARAAWAWLSRDPRHGQLATLGTLLPYGLWRLGFDIGIAQVVVTIGAALATQAFFDRHTGRPLVSGAKSALISALSLCLLLRTDMLALAGVAAALAVSSKFLLRAGGKHLFNPTNGAIVALLLVSDDVWVSPGQWGTQPTLAFFLASAGLLVVTRATTADVTVAFMGSYALLLVTRSVWLGEPFSIPLHRLESGAFLLFSFFMISDPKTTPNARGGRVIFAAVVASAAAYVQFKLFRTNGLLWALAAASPLVPLLDRVFPAIPYRWPRIDRSMVRPLAPLPGGGSMLSPSSLTRHVTSLIVVCATAVLSPVASEAFCGFYVGRADATLFNKASQVVLVRDGDRTVLTMGSDFRGDVKEFALVVPVPTSITREQIHIGDRALVERLDAFTAPRLVEYFDEDPCLVREEARRAPMAVPAIADERLARGDRAKSLGVTIEASYTVGEYDILILSAEQSGGLEAWLRESGYRIPVGASRVLDSYIKQRMRFFVAKVNLKEQAKLGFAHLRPIQVAYESPKFMLPIRLGMVNADGAQELFIYTLTRKGRVETTNYRTVTLQTDVEIPTFVKDPREFARMYRALFDMQVEREKMSAVFQEYAWDMAWCDPCAADPLSADELARLGVFWVDRPREPPSPGGFRRRVPALGGGAQDVFVTRLHVRYDQAHFPEDLVFQETGDRTNFQGRYVLRHAWSGPTRCAEAASYGIALRERREREAQTLATLTGWRIEDIRAKMQASLPPEWRVPAAGSSDAVEPWWRRVWRR